jgi:hypothetical protein
VKNMAEEHTPLTPELGKGEPALRSEGDLVWSNRPLVRNHWRRTPLLGQTFLRSHHSSQARNARPALSSVLGC